MSAKDRQAALTEGQTSSFIEEPPRQERSRLSSTWWTWELLSVTASFACMTALVVILFRLQNKPATWWHFYVSINATIATLATAARAALLMGVSACLSQEKWLYFKRKSQLLQHLTIFDEASRGPMGALQMLFAMPRGIASLGATVVLLSLATDAFVQQVISFESDSIYVQDGFATFGFAHSYDSGTKRNPGQIDGATLPDFFSYDDFSIDSAMQGAIYRGLYQDTWPQSFNCTSNCTWDQDYITLGFGSTCQNVTEDTLSTKHCAPGNLSLDDCEMVTPGGVNLTTHYQETDWQSAWIVNTSSLLPTSQALNGLDFIRVAVWNTPANLSNWANNGDQGIIGENVVECTLGFSAWKYYNISSASNYFTIGGAQRLSLGPGFEANYIPDMDSNYDSGGIWFNQSGLPFAFYISSSDVGALVDFFVSSSFSGEMYEGESEPPHAKGCTVAFLMKNTSQIFDIFDNVAKSMTDQLREGRMMQLAYGMTSQPVVYIRVQWAWLSLPIFLQLSGGVLLIFTMFGSRRSKRVPLWKSSPLALLYYRIEPDGVMTSDIKGPRELEQLSKTVQARLE